MVDDDVPVVNLDNIDFRPSNSQSIIIGRDNPHAVLYTGAHIAAGVGQGPYHHGIVLDADGEMVIAHFWGRDKTMARIQTTTLAAFIAGDPNDIGNIIRPLHLINYPDDNDEKRAQTVERARKKLESADTIYYDIISSNCESFAYYCRTGQWESEQSNRVIAIIKSVARRVGRAFLSASRPMWTLIQNSSTARTSNLSFLSLLASGSLVSGSSTSLGSSSSIPLISVSPTSIASLSMILLPAALLYSISSEGSIGGTSSSLSDSISNMSAGTLRLAEGSTGSTARIIDSVSSSVNGTISASQRIMGASVNVTTQTLGSLRRGTTAATNGTVGFGRSILNLTTGSLGSLTSSSSS